MKPSLKSIGRLVRPIRKLHDARNSLLIERDQLLADREAGAREREALRAARGALERELGALRAERDALLSAQQSAVDTHDAVLRSRVALAMDRDRLMAEHADLAPILIARAESRLIITDYPYHPDRRDLRSSPAGRRLVQRLHAGEEGYVALLRDFAGLVDGHLARIARDEAPDAATEPFWGNPWFPPLDGVSLYGLLARFRPRRYVEVGSGNSTRFARRAIRDLGLDTRVVSIDPHPRADIDAICDHVVRQPLESVGPAFWKEFGPQDMLFVDNSHRSFTNSDVTVFFTDILPDLPAGAIWGLHDIFLPDDYPADWRDRYFNEQYLLLAYLDGGAGTDEILLPLAWATSQPRLHGVLAPLWQRDGLFRDVPTVGGAFWMRRTAPR
jgi:Methyltransferase domain